MCCLRHRPPGRGLAAVSVWCFSVCVKVGGGDHIIEEGLHGPMGLACSVAHTFSAGETQSQRLKGRPPCFCTLPWARASVGEMLASIPFPCGHAATAGT